MQRTRSSAADTRVAHASRARRGGLAAAALLVASAGLATTATGADAAPKKKAPVTVTRVAGVPKTTTGAGAFKVTSTVRNATRKPAKATVVVRLSTDKKVDGQDVRLASGKTGALRPKAKKKVSTPVVLPKVLGEGSYFVIACVGSSCRAASTTVLRSDTPPPAATDQGTLSGSLTFARTALEGWSSVDDKTQINVAMNYKGPFAVSNDLVNTGSTTSYSHTHSKTETTDQGCTTTTTDTTSASRPLVSKGDRYTDEIYGGIVYNDYSEVDVDLNIEYLYTTKVVKAGGPDCPQETKESTHKSWDLMTVRLRETSRSGADVTYQVKSLTGSMGGSAPWKDVTGALTLHLG